MITRNVLILLVALISIVAKAEYDVELHPLSEKNFLCRKDSVIFSLEMRYDKVVKRSDPKFCEALWKVLQHPSTVANLASVGKSYGSGAIKVEPRSLERLPLSEVIVGQAGLFVPKLLLEKKNSYSLVLEL